MADRPQLVIFSDLDGTLLDYERYTFTEALPALRRIKQRDIPLVICSSKTAAEIEFYRRKLDNNHPFVSENGGGIFVPKGYFAFRLSDWLTANKDDSIHLESEGEYDILRLGARYGELRNALLSLRAEGFPIRGFGDMPADEVAVLTGLSLEEAFLAKEREFDEPFVVDAGPEVVKKITDAIKTLGLYCVTGRIKHIIGPSDKGKAVSLVASMYKTVLNDLTTIGVGDAPNDLPMLYAVDHPIVVQQPDGSYHSDMMEENVTKAEGRGPVGWNHAVMELLTRLGTGDSDEPLL